MATSRDRYIALQDDVAEGWTLGSTLTYIGLGILAPTKSTPSITTNGTIADFSDLYVHCLPSAIPGPFAYTVQT